MVDVSIITQGHALRVAGEKNIRMDFYPFLTFRNSRRLLSTVMI